MSEEYLDKLGLERVAEYVNNKIARVLTLPSDATEGLVVLYVGGTSATAIQGHVYKAQGGSWVDIFPNANEIDYSNIASGMTATNVQDAIDELKVDFNNIPRGLIPKGTILFANLPSLASSEVGDMYNVSDDFVTTSDFVVPNVPERGGSNVYCINVGTDVSPVKKWDVFAVADVVLNVNPSAAAIATFPAGTMWLVE